MGHHRGPLPRRRYITDDMGVRQAYKLCLRCRRWLPATIEQFMPRASRAQSGGPPTLRSPCRRCHAEASHEWERRVRTDPARIDQLVRLRENQRIAYRLRMARNGTPARVLSEEAYRARYGQPWTRRYAVAPERVALLAAELERVFAMGADTIEEVSARAEVPERRIWEVRTKHVASLWTVDRLCLAIGMPLIELEQ